MKKYIHIVFLCLTTIAFSQEQKVIEEAGVNTQVSFGRQGNDCKGRGVCSFTIHASKTETNTKIIYNNDNTITLIIDRTNIAKEDEHKIVGQFLTATSKVNTLTFVLEEDFGIDSELKSDLKIASLVTKIAKGYYPVHITKDTFTITFKIE